MEEENNENSPIKNGKKTLSYAKILPIVCLVLCTVQPILSIFNAETYLNVAIDFVAIILASLVTLGLVSHKDAGKNADELQKSIKDDLTRSTSTNQDKNENKIVTKVK